MVYILPIVVSLGAGVVVGGALAAFLSLLEIFPRLVQITETDKYVVFYENVIMIASVGAIIVYFTDIYLPLGNVLTGIIGLIMGIFIGMFSSALAEVLNVMPVISKKFKIKDNIKWILYFILAGKVAGSLYYWIIY